MKYPLYALIALFLLSCGGQNTKTESQSEESVSASNVTSAELSGAWETSYVGEDGVERRIVAILSDGFIAGTEFGAVDGKFYSTYGGAYNVSDNTFNLSFEFDTSDSTNVGKTLGQQFMFDSTEIKFEGDERVWRRVDDGTPGRLNGAWLITGRMRDGAIGRRTPGPRKTMKILSGTRFQWIAYNVETKQFRGTGGGSYTTTDSVYAENIEFFSRNDSRVGASLQFTYELVDGEWHHSGYSSNGDAMYEIWTRRFEVE